MGLDIYLVTNSRRAAQDSYLWHEENCPDRYLGEVRSGSFAYWRKANFLIAWFENEMHCDREQFLGGTHPSLAQLEKLHDDCRAVLDSTRLVEKDVEVNEREWDPEAKKLVSKKAVVRGKFLEDSSTAEELLPTTEGFFFGSQMYDEWYWQDVEYTYRFLDWVLGHMGKYRHGDGPGVWYDWSAEWPGDEDWDFDIEFSASW